MLSQMKKYLKTDDAEKPAEKAPAISEPVRQAPEKARSDKKEVRKLPVEESLFEFDDIVFDEVVIEKPVLTPEEAEYVDELSEKFGISTNVGVAFLDDTPAQEVVISQPRPIEEEYAEPESDEEAEFVAEAESDEEAEFVAESESDGEAEFVAESEFDEEAEFVAVAESDGEAEFVAESELEEKTEIESEELAIESETREELEAEEPEQVSIGVSEEYFDEPNEAPSPALGVQLTFLDSGEEDDFDGEDDEDELVEQISISEYEEEYDNIDEDDEEFLSLYDEDEDEPPIFEEPVFEAPEFGEPVLEEAAFFAEELPESESEPAPVQELTPIELAAMEDAQREAEQPTEEIEPEEAVPQEPKTDIWDCEDSAECEEKKRFSEFCNGLEIPPIKTSKDTQTVAGEQKEGFVYKFEMAERMPLFPDGIGSGKYTESYISRERAYCEEREKKRSAQLIDKLRFTSRKLICSLAVLLMVLLVENLGVFLSGKPDALLTGKHSTVFGLAVAVLLTIGAAMVFDGIIDGIKSAVNGVFIPETLSAFVVIPSLVYHYIIAFCAPVSKYSMLFGTGAAAVMLLMGLYRYNMLKREQITFSVTSSYGRYLTEAQIADFKNSPEGRAYDGYADSESSLYKLNKVSRIDAPYNDTVVRDECFGIIRTIALCMICAAVVFGVVFGIIRKDVVYGAISAISLLTYACPAGVFIALSLPRLRAAAVSAELGGAIVDFDDESDEFDASVIMIEEEEMFPPEKLAACDFKFQQSEQIELHISRTRALFKKIGGSLGSVFYNVQGTTQHFESIVVTEIAPDGISAKIDGVPICAGSEAYMKKLGIKIKTGDKLLPKTGRYMYVADNGVFSARATLVFKVNEDLVHKISELRNTETVFALKSCNPCIDEELLFHATGLEPELLRLVKYRAGDDTAPAKTDREGSLVSKNGSLGLLTALLEYKRQKKLTFEATRFACGSCVAGAAVSLITSIIGVNFGFSALIMLATQGVMALAAFLMAKSGAINTKSKVSRSLSAGKK